MLQLLDYFFSFLHLALIAFNLTGWIWKRTRKAHLITVAATAGSWFILGIWFGWGYCPITDWQWDVKNKLGEHGLPSSFIKYFADRISNRNIDSSIVNDWTLYTFLAIIAVTVYVNFIRKPRRQ